MEACRVWHGFCKIQLFWWDVEMEKNSIFLKDNFIEAFKMCTSLLSRFWFSIFQAWLYPSSFTSNWVQFPGGGNFLWYFCPIKVKIMFSNQHCLNWHAHVAKQFISSKNAHWLEIVWKLIFQMGQNAKCSVKCSFYIFFIIKILFQLKFFA